ncbi:MAG: tRNA (N6-isopentenyl adenosine(37)-C2)-methylthiotransferase MiaB [Christensenellaceae bacterium]|nr:tRNA (N6-isopentenyl adenosine(37)-C2)-methylthiotransferase MiaB [Christensenellaceae bacterium]
MEKCYHIHTYGCQMNVHESEKLAGVLNKLGYTETPDEKQASVIVFNTCCIRESAEQHVYGNIGALKQHKKQNPELIIAVCGCMSQQKATADNIKAKYPFVNIVFGTHNIHMFEEYLKEAEKEKHVFALWEKEQEIVENTSVYRTSDNNAWVNITYGCNNFCTYCIVPFVRGRERSRKAADIINEVKGLIGKYKTITLLGQNVNSYGKDFGDGTDFAGLLEDLAKLEGDFRIKFLTSHPKDLSQKVINVIAKNNKMSKTIHLPVQSGSNKILKLMNRSYTREHYISLIDSIKKAMPDAVITTDIIVGFPGETDSDFEETMDLLRYCNFAGIFAFMYSKRRGTPAEIMDGQVSIETKRKRVNAALDLQRKISAEVMQSFLGKTLEVLTEMFNGKVVGRTEFGKLVDLDKEAEQGSFYEVEITKILSKKFAGKILNKRVL